jgi:threonyl-tRNA synthetase
VAQNQDLVMFHKYSPGAAFFLPNGTRIYNALLQFLREQYRIRGFEEVITPNVYHSDLWKQSGHYEHYKDDMFVVSCSPSTPSPSTCTHGDHQHQQVTSDQGEEMLKPMNCPAHCLIFGRATHSYRELPIRLADFGVLHRYAFTTR